MLIKEMHMTISEHIKDVAEFGKMIGDIVHRCNAVIMSPQVDVSDPKYSATIETKNAAQSLLGQIQNLQHSMNTIKKMAEGMESL